MIDTHDSEISHNVIVDGNDNLVLLGSDRNSIHHNEIRKGRHSVLALKCRFSLCCVVFVAMKVNFYSCKVLTIMFITIKCRMKFKK